MVVNRVEYHLTTGEIIQTTGNDAEDFAQALLDERITTPWLIFPISERMGSRTIINLAQVTHIHQFYALDEIEQEEEQNDQQSQ